MSIVIRWCLGRRNRPTLAWDDYRRYLYSVSGIVDEMERRKAMPKPSESLSKSERYPSVGRYKPACHGQFMEPIFVSRMTAREWMLRTGEHAIEMRSLVGEELYNQILADMDEFAEYAVDSGRLGLTAKKAVPEDK